MLFRSTPLEKLVEIPGIGEKTAEKVLATAQEFMAAQAATAAAAAVEHEFTPEMEPSTEASSVEDHSGVPASPEAAEGVSRGE